MNQFIGAIKRIDWGRGLNRVYFSGYALLEGINIDQNNKVKKSLIISNGKKKFFVPVQNILDEEITFKLGQEKYNYNFAGFEGYIDLGYINDMNPISDGEWNIGLYINADGVETEVIIPYDGQPIKVEPKKLRLSHSNKVYNVDLLINSNNEIVLPVVSEVISASDKLKYKLIDSSFGEWLIKTKKNIKNNLIKRKRKLGNFIMKNLYKITVKMRIKQNRVTFLSDSRVDFTGNFEFIYNELQERGTYEIKSILKPSINAKRSFGDKIRLIYYISTSRYILLDDYYPQIYKYKIKDGVDVIQLWHACGAFKTFGFSRLGKVGGPSPRSKNHRNYTTAIVSSSAIRKHYAEAFGISEERVISTGVPRTDIFFDEEYKNKKIDELYKKYPILKDKKVIMFAPTFRGNGQKTAHYDFEKLDLKLLKEHLGDEYMIIMKLHPFIKNVPEIKDEFKDFIIDLSQEREINDLLFVADILITDYSSVCFEYSLLNRPMIFFAYDLEEYIASRDFYYPYKSFVPGPIAKNTKDIIEIIESQNFEKEKLESFREKFFDHFDGKSTKRVVDMLMNIENNM